MADRDLGVCIRTTCWCPCRAKLAAEVARLTRAAAVVPVPAERSSAESCDLIKMLDLHVDGVRHYLHLQIGRPLSKHLISAPEIALDNLRREVKAAIQSRDVAQSVGVRLARPSAWICTSQSEAFVTQDQDAVRAFMDRENGWTVVPLYMRSALDLAAPQNNAERPPSSDAVEAGADTRCSAGSCGGADDLEHLDGMFDDRERG